MQTTPNFQIVDAKAFLTLGGFLFCFFGGFLFLEVFISFLTLRDLLQKKKVGSIIIKRQSFKCISRCKIDSKIPSRRILHRLLHSFK